MTYFNSIPEIAGCALIGLWIFCIAASTGFLAKLGHFIIEMIDWSFKPAPLLMFSVFFTYIGFEHDLFTGLIATCIAAWAIVRFMIYEKNEKYKAMP
jgi:Mg2+/citrate symporter